MPSSEDDANKDFEPSNDTVSDDEFEEGEEIAPKKQRTDKTAGSKRAREQPSNDTESSKEAIFELSKSRRIAVRRFASKGSSPGKPSVDIREMYTDKVTGERKHGKGICLPLEQWEKLKELMPKIDSAIERL